tara:strand:+ start:12981 stop:14387 length:1407 start_codon:yes stop_codon:yes gene_type:complete
MKNICYIYLFISVITCFLISCKKNKILTNKSFNIETSTDSILFDTLFTTIGSTTKYFKCHNKHSGILKISNISLENSTNSPFRINVDGISGVYFEDIEILPGDSIFIFVEVTIDPSSGNLPFIVEDKINFNTNGNTSVVTLNAWGQDAIFHVNEIVSGNWTNEKPHVIYGLAAVGFPKLDSNLSLTIEPGTKVYGHTNAILYVYKSSLQINGDLDNPVSFQQDRLEDYLLYSADSVAGQWRGIYLSHAFNSSILHTEIKNAVVGIQIDTFSNNSNVVLNKTKINNSLYANILTQGANLFASNCLFGNSNNYSGFISIGGTVQFENCTFANYAYTNRSTPSVILKDYYESTNSQVISRPFEIAKFINCVIDGNNKTELILDTISNYNSNFGNILFDHCAIKSEDSLVGLNLFNNCFLNLQSDFQDIDSWDFDLNENSELIDLGASSSIIDDILERPRTAPNDLGCYEFQ